MDCSTFAHPPPVCCAILKHIFWRAYEEPTLGVVLHLDYTESAAAKAATNAARSRSRQSRRKNFGT